MLGRVSIFGRRYETEDTGANSRSPDHPLNEATDGREEDTIAASTCLCTESCTVLLPVLTVALGTGRCAEGAGGAAGTGGEESIQRRRRASDFGINRARNRNRPWTDSENDADTEGHDQGR